MYNCRGRVLPRLLPRCIRGKASLQRAAAFAASLHTREGVPSNLRLSWQSAAAFAASLHTREGVIATCCRVCCLVAYAGRRAIKFTIVVAECCRVCCLVAYAGRRHCNVLPRLPPRCTRGQCVANVAYVTIRAFHVCHLSS